MSKNVKPTSDPSRRKEERVLEAAKTCFTRYGFRKTTMADIANAAQVSRPALYLMYRSKEEVLGATVAHVFDAMLLELREGVAARDDPFDQLQFAFEVWCVRGYDIVHHTPDAADLLENGHQLAGGAWEEADAGFEAVLVGILDRVPRAEPARGPATARVAHVLAAAVPGLKAAAGSASELRSMIDDFLGLVLDGLQAPAAAGRIGARTPG